MFATAVAQKELAGRKFPPVDKPAWQPSAVSKSPLLQRKASCACGGDCPRCNETDLNNSIQPKLNISTPGDVHEQEADRVAEQVMRMPDPILQSQNKGGLDASGSSGGEEPLIRRQVKSEGSTSEVAADFTSPLGNGMPLDEASRTFFEPRFGQDFADVRIHTGARATESAHAVGARAYTIGRDVVFGSSEYAPHTQAGRTLLAHELTHVVQQRRGDGPTIQRQSSPGQTAADAPAKPKPKAVPCTDAEREELIKTQYRALPLILTEFDLFIKSAQAKDPAQRGKPASVGEAIARNFHVTGDAAKPVIEIVKQRLEAVSGSDLQAINIRCAVDPTFRDCPLTDAFISDDKDQVRTLTLCPSLFALDEHARLPILVREMVRFWNNDVTDRRSTSQRGYADLSTEEALHNASSYAQTAAEIYDAYRSRVATSQHTPTPAATASKVGAPTDTYPGCDTAMTTTLTNAIRKAEEINLNALKVMSDRDQIKAHASALAMYGLPHPVRPKELADAYRLGYELANNLFKKSVSVICEKSDSPSCKSGKASFDGAFHVCSSWKDLPDDDARSATLLKAVYLTYTKGEEFAADQLTGAVQDLAKEMLALPTRDENMTAEPKQPMIDREEALEEGFLLLQGAAFGTAVGTQTGSDQRDRYDKRYWVELPGKHQTLTAKVEPWLAFSKLVEFLKEDRSKPSESRRWSFDCFEGVIVPRLYSYWRTMKRSEFNLKFSPLELGYTAVTHLEYKAKIFALKPGDPPSTYVQARGTAALGGTVEDALKKVSVNKTWAELLKDAPPGSQVIWTNQDAVNKCAKDPSLNFCAFQNENTTKLVGTDRFGPHPFGTVFSEAQVIDAMARAVLDDGKKANDPKATAAEVQAYIKKYIYISTIMHPNW